MSESIREIEAVLEAFMRADEHIGLCHENGEKPHPEAHAERAYAALFIAKYMASRGRERLSAARTLERMRGQDLVSGQT